MRSHEGPFGESVATVVVVRPAAKDHRSNKNKNRVSIKCNGSKVIIGFYIPSAHGRREEHFYVSSTRRVQADDGLNVFQIVYFRLAPLARTSVNRKDDGTVTRDRPVE